MPAFSVKSSMIDTLLPVFLEYENGIDQLPLTGTNMPGQCFE
jgi:hypothetical protein